MSDQYPTVRAAAIQAAPIFLDREATLDKACALIREAGRGGAQFIVFPEGFVPSHPSWFVFHPALSRQVSDWNVRLFKNALQIPGPDLDRVGAAARDAGAYVVLGACEKSPDTLGTLYNSQVFFGPDGRYLGRHQKLTPTATERLVHAPGSADTFGALPTEFGPVSALVCGENSNPLAIFALAAEGTRIHAMSWPNHLGVGRSLPPRVLGASQAFAQMTKTFVVSAAATVDEATIAAMDVGPRAADFLREPRACGGSVIVAPNAEVLAGPLGHEEGILYADLDLEQCVRLKLMADIAGHYNRPDVFQLHVTRRTAPLYAREPAGAPSAPGAAPARPAADGPATAADEPTP